MKKIITLLSTITIMLAVSVCFSASAAEERVVIDNVVYELTEDKTYGQHYAVTDFFEDEALAEITTKINIIDEIDGVEVLGIKTNYNDCPDGPPSPAYNNSYPSVKKVILPDNMKYIDFYGLNCFPSVERLYLPEDLLRMGEGAFMGMESLKSITIPSGVHSIYYRAFENCKTLTKVVLGENVEYISDYAFNGCESLTTINFPDSLKSIGDWAFSETALTKVVIPENVKLWEGPFSGCKNIEKIVFEDVKNYTDDYISIDDMTYASPSTAKAIYIKAIPAKGINFYNAIPDMPQLKDIYFAGSEDKWNELVDEDERAELDMAGITVHFYYRHAHNFIKSGNVTCTKGGTYTYSCECGDSYSYKVAKNTEGHKFGSWKVKSKSTYTVAGIKERKCSLCGKVEKKNLAVPKLGLVTNFEQISTLNSVSITWKSVNGANGYRVYKQDAKTKKYVKVASIKNKTTYTFKNLEKGQSYPFKIQPYFKDSKGNVAFGPESQAFHAKTLATAPANLKAESTEPGVVKLTWDSSGDGATYYITRSTSREELAEGKGKDLYVGKPETKTIKNLKSGTTYYFIVNMQLYRTDDGVKTSNIIEVTVK